MLVLGIETSCDETAVALYDGEKGLVANRVFSQVELHRRHGGVVPELDSREHIERLLPLIEAADHDIPILARDLPVFREVAGDHATYFSGKDPAVLADAIRRWLVALESGSAPGSSGLPRLTWRESALQLLGAIGMQARAEYVSANN